MTQMSEDDRCDALYASCLMRRRRADACELVTPMMASAMIVYYLLMPRQMRRLMMIRHVLRDGYRENMSGDGAGVTMLYER